MTAVVASITTHRLSVPLHTPFVTALRRTTTVETLVCEVADSDGRVGWGEAPQVWQVTGESVPGAEACVAGPLAAALVGRPAEPAESGGLVARAVVGNHGAKAAVDVALHDLALRRAGTVVGGRVRTDVTIASGTCEQMAEAAVDRVADGFTVLKLKVGADARSDVDRVRAVRAAVGQDVMLRLDANQGWDAVEAVRAVRAMEDAGLGLELVEQPVPARDLLGLAFVRTHVETPVMADESVFGLDDLVEVIRHDAADLVNVKLAKCGGLTPALELVRVARAHGLGVAVGSMMETHVGVGAAALLAATVGTDVVADLDAGWWARCSPCVGGIRYDGEHVVLPGAPGLGVEGLAR